MLDFILNCSGLALFTAWCLNVFTISGWREKCIMNVPNNFLVKLLSCDFCLSFWSCLIITIICAIPHDWSLLVTPFIFAPIIKKLI